MRVSRPPPAPCHSRIWAILIQETEWHLPRGWHVSKDSMEDKSSEGSLRKSPELLIVPEHKNEEYIVHRGSKEHLYLLSDSVGFLEFSVSLKMLMCQHLKRRMSLVWLAPHQSPSSGINHSDSDRLPPPTTPPPSLTPCNHHSSKRLDQLCWGQVFSALSLRSTDLSALQFPPGEK